MDNKINSLLKQNEAIYNSLKSKNINDIGELISSSEDINLEILTKENIRLKNLSKQNKPQPPPKIVQSEKKQIEEEEEYIEPIKQFECITNMEDIKRAFFGCENNDYSQFDELVKAHNFKLYQVNYKYSTDKDGAPSYSAKNLVGGFIRNFDNLRKYFMICFRCIKHDTTPVTYTYPSYWILNSTNSLQEIIGSLYDDYDFIEINDKDNFYNLIHKMNPNDETLITEGYVH
jgi:hypothetical protein